jgi:nucleoside-diphosphate-sugar epimerase
VCGQREGRILERIERDRPPFNNEYERSKFEAEHLVQKRMAGRPYSIFRPSIIVGDSRDGHVSAFSTLYLPLKLMARGALRWLPCEPTAKLDLVTVDFVASAIGQLLLTTPARGEVYHVTAGDAGAVTIEDLARAAIQIAGVDRHRPMRFSPALWFESEAASRVKIFFDYLHGTRRFDTRTLERALGRSASRHAPAKVFLPAAFDFCRQTDWGSHLPWTSASAVEAAP